MAYINIAGSVELRQNRRKVSCFSVYRQDRQRHETSVKHLPSVPWASNNKNNKRRRKQKLEYCSSTPSALGL